MIIDLIITDHDHQVKDTAQEVPLLVQNLMGSEVAKSVLSVKCTNTMYWKKKDTGKERPKNLNRKVLVNLEVITKVVIIIQIKVINTFEKINTIHVEDIFSMMIINVHVMITRDQLLQKHHHLIKGTSFFCILITHSSIDFLVIKRILIRLCYR